MAVLTYTKTGTKAASSAKLPKSIFGLESVSRSLLKQAYVTYLANGRQNLAVTKTRGLVRGGGIKPWRQKGTGRARVGSRRTPVWRGGGIVFGPTGMENYHLNMNLKTKRLALCQALTSASSEGRIRVIESLTMRTPKTSAARQLLGKLDLSGYTLIIDGKPDLILRKALNNLPDVKLVEAAYINVANIMDADTLLITKSGLETLENWLGGEGK